MAGRIRTIKPEILENERTAGLQHDAWRLFVSMITLADDYGNLNGHPERLTGSVFWASGLSRGIRELLAELSGAELVRLYSVRGQSYVAIVGWKQHQKVDKPGNPRVPGPDQADSSTRETVANESRVSREPLAPDQYLRSGSPISDHDPLAPAIAVAAMGEGKPRRKRKPAEQRELPSPLPFTIAAMLDALRSPFVVVEPFDESLAKPLTAVIRSLDAAHVSLDDIALAGAYLAATVPTWGTGEPVGLSWIATAGRLSTAIGKARNWRERGKPGIKPANGHCRPEPTNAVPDAEATARYLAARSLGGAKGLT